MYRNDHSRIKGQPKHEAVTEVISHQPFFLRLNGIYRKHVNTKVPSSIYINI